MGEDPAAKFIANLQRLHSKTLPQSSRLRLCISCRYYPNLFERGGLSVAVEKENSRDINSFIEAHTALTKFRPSDRKAIAELINRRANGIFQWVSLVLDKVTHLRRRGQPATAVIARIKEVPGTLKGIYDALLTFKNEHDRKQTLKLFQWVLFSFPPLDLVNLRNALAIDADMPHNTVEQITKSDYYYQLEDMPTVVQDLSKGLARVRKHPYRQIHDDYRWAEVETIDQSVNDYLLRSGLADLAQCCTGSVEGLAYFQISRCLIKLLLAIPHSASSLQAQGGCSDQQKSSDENEDRELVEEDRDNRFALLDDWIDKVPLAAFAQDQWLNLVIKVERYEIDQQDLLEILPWRNHCGTLPLIFTKHLGLILRRRIDVADNISEAEMLAETLYHQQPYSLDPPQQKLYRWDPVHLLALTGIHSALEKMEQIEPEIYSRMDPSGYTTLLFALAGGNEHIVASAMGKLAHNHVHNERFMLSPLFLAVKHHRDDWVQAIIHKGAELDQMNRLDDDFPLYKTTALYQAWKEKDGKIVRLLLFAGADPSIVCFEPYDSDTTVIHKAVKEADEWSKSMLPLLLESTMKLYATRKLPDLMNCAGIQLQNISLVQFLLDSGALQGRSDDAHTKDEGAFNTAAARGLQGMVKDLLNNMIKPSSSSFGMSPLHEAAANGHPSIVRLLLDAGAQPTGYGYSCRVASEHLNWWDTPDLLGSRGYRSHDPMEMAIINGHISVVQAFLDVINTPEADTKSKVEEIRSLPWERYLQLAVKENFPAAVRTFLNLGVDPNRIGCLEKPLLHIAVEKGSVEVARMLLHNGADPTLTDISLNTALQRAIGGNHLEILNLLLDWRDTHGRTLIMLETFVSEQFKWLPLTPRRFGMSRAIQQVLDTEYIFNVQDNKGLTVLSYAVMEERLMIVDHLLYHGRSDPNKQSLQGETPLMRAASAGFEDILRRLLACPLTDISIEDEDGLTAMDHARRAGNSTAVALLRKKQDELLAQNGGGALPLRAIVPTDWTGTLRRHQY